MLSWSAPCWLATLLLSLCRFMWVMFLGSWPTVAILHLETMEEQGCGMAANGYLKQERGAGGEGAAFEILGLPASSIL